MFALGFLGVYVWQRRRENRGVTGENRNGATAPKSVTTSPLHSTGIAGRKRMGTAALLAIIPALLGFFGIAHFYRGRLGTGLLFLFAGWVMLGAGIFCLFTGDWVWAIVLGVIWIGLLIWQVFDALAIPGKTMVSEDGGI